MSEESKCTIRPFCFIFLTGEGENEIFFFFFKLESSSLFNLGIDDLDILLDWDILNSNITFSQNFFIFDRFGFEDHLKIRSILRIET